MLYLFRICQNFEPSLALFAAGQIFASCKWPNIEQIIKASGHSGLSIQIFKVGTVEGFRVGTPVSEKGI